MSGPQDPEGGPSMSSDRTPADQPIAMRLPCPSCGELHIDEGEFATKPHHTHACQSCGMVWRPAVVDTVGVRFLPGYRNAALLTDPEPIVLCPACGGHNGAEGYVSCELCDDLGAVAAPQDLEKCPTCASREPDIRGCEPGYDAQGWPIDCTNSWHTQASERIYDHGEDYR